MFNTTNLKTVINNIDITDNIDIINRSKLLKYFNNNSLLLKYFIDKNDQILMEDFIDFLVLCYNNRECKYNKELDGEKYDKFILYEDFTPYINLIEYLEDFSIFHNWIVYKIVNHPFLKDYLNEDSFYINYNYEIISVNYSFGIDFKGIIKPHNPYFLLSKINNKLDRKKRHYITIDIRNLDVNFSIYFKKIITQITEFLSHVIIKKHNKLNEYFNYLYFKSFTRDNQLKDVKLLEIVYDLLKEKSYDYRVINYLHIKKMIKNFYDIFNIKYEIEDNILENMILTTISSKYKNYYCIHWLDLIDLIELHFEIFNDIHIYRVFMFYLRILDKVFDEYIHQSEFFNEILKMKKFDIIDIYKDKLSYIIQQDNLLLKNKKVKNVRSLCIKIKKFTSIYEKLCLSRDKLLINYKESICNEVLDIMKTIDIYIESY
jgi:hypothetical protein